MGTATKKNVYKLVAYLCQLFNGEIQLEAVADAYPIKMPLDLTADFVPDPTGSPLGGVGGKGTQANAKAFNQGSLITVCVMPDVTAYGEGIRMNGLTTFDWLRITPPNNQEAIVNLESDRSTIVSNNEWYLVLANVLLDNFTKFERCFLSVNSDWLESTLGIHKNSEVLVGLINSEDIHLSEWESVFSSDLSVNLDHTLSILTDLERILSVKSILKSLLENNVKWNTLSELMRSWCWSSRVNSLQFTKIPHLGCGNSFK